MKLLTEERLLCVKKDKNHNHLTIGKEYDVILNHMGKLSISILCDDNILYTYIYPNVKFKNVKDIRNKAIDNILK